MYYIPCYDDVLVYNVYQSCLVGTSAWLSSVASRLEIEHRRLVRVVRISCIRAGVRTLEASNQPVLALRQRLVGGLTRCSGLPLEHTLLTHILSQSWLDSAVGWHIVVVGNPASKLVGVGLEVANVSMRSGVLDAEADLGRLVLERIKDRSAIGSLANEMLDKSRRLSQNRSARVVAFDTGVWSASSGDAVWNWLAWRGDNPAAVDEQVGVVQVAWRSDGDSDSGRAVRWN
ncbi:hypothetical protein GQ42DRAFT_66553 [Ramicandelaber brevisporus]|nr:hypothetical protein GQ42DRAFT_66553 [Ramicandelaber brevisporus]